MRSLVQTAIAKLEVDLPLLLAEDNELLLTHTIEEVLLFHAELRNFGYPAQFPCILNALTTDRCFIRWIALEKKCEFLQMAVKVVSDLSCMELKVEGFSIRRTENFCEITRDRFARLSIDQVRERSSDRNSRSIFSCR